MNVIEQARIYNQGVEEGKRQAAQKPWVDLSDEEIDALAELYGLDYMSYAPFVRALNAKLREKNT
jgi:D-serine dehydratase